MTDGGARISVRGEAVTVPPHHAPVPMGRSTHRPPVTSRIASSAGATADGAVGRRRGCDDRGDRDRGARGAVGGPRPEVDRTLEPGLPGPDGPRRAAPAARPWSRGDRRGAAVADLVLRQLSTPALLVVAVTEGERTRCLRIGLDPTGATLERSDDDHPSRWTELAVAEVPAAVSALLEDSGIDLAPARLEITGDEHALRLTPKQNRLAQAALAEGVPAEEAFATLPDLDDPLREALTATGPRLSLSLTLHD